MTDAAEVTLWSFTHEFSNSFIQYLIGGMGLMYLVTLFITYCGSETTPLIQNIAPQDHSIPEKKLHKYLLIVDTSFKPGVSCPRQTVIYLELIGEVTKSGFSKISVYTNGRFIFQHGNKDLFLIKTKQCLGKIMEVKIIVNYEKWRPVRTEVVKTSTGDRYLVPTRVINPENKNCPEDGILYPVTKRSLCSTILMALLQYHHWLSFLLPNRIGVYTSTVNILVLFLGMSLLLVGTLIVYIVKAPAAGESLQINQRTLDWTIYVSIFTVISVSVFQTFLQNIRSGYVPDIKKVTEHMFENEEKLNYNNRNAMYDYLEQKKFNFASEYENVRDYSKLENSTQEFKSCLEFERIEQSSKHFKSCIELENMEQTTSHELNDSELFRNIKDIGKVYCHTTFKPSESESLLEVSKFDDIDGYYVHKYEYEEIDDISQNTGKKSSQKEIHTQTEEENSKNDLNDFHLFKSAIEFGNLSDHSSKILDKEASRQDDVAKSNLDDFKSVIEVDHLLNNALLLTEKQSMEKTGRSSDEKNEDISEKSRKMSYDSSFKTNLMSLSEEGVQSKQIVTTVSDTRFLSFLQPSHLDNETSEPLIKDKDESQVSVNEKHGSQVSLNEKHGSQVSVNVKHGSQVSVNEKPGSQVSVNEKHRVEPAEKNKNENSMSDVDSAKGDNKENILLMSTSSAKIDENMTSLHKFVMECNDESPVIAEDTRGECLLSLKQVIRNVNLHQTCLKRKIRQGNTKCFTGLEIVVRKWCEVLRNESYKLVISLAIQKGISKAVLIHYLELIPKLRESVSSMSSCHVCTIIEQCCDRLTNQRTLTRPDVEEISLMMIVRLYKMADDLFEMILLPGISQEEMASTFRAGGEFSSSSLMMDHSELLSVSMISLRGSPTTDKRSGGLIEYLTQQSACYSLTSSEFSVLYALASSVVKLSFHNQEWILREDWNQLMQGHTSEYLDNFFKQKQKELLTVWKLCSQVMEDAQQELWEEYNDVTYIYTQFMVRQLVLSSLQKLSTDKNEYCHELKHTLYKQWQKHGLKPRLNAVKCLSEILVSRFIAQVTDANKDQTMTDENSLFYPLSQSHMLCRIQKKVEHEILRSVKKQLFSRGGLLRFVSKYDGLMSLFDRGDNFVEEHTCVMVDAAIQDIVSILPKITKDVVMDQLFVHMAPDLVRKVFDSAKHSLMVENQIKLYEEYEEITVAREFTSTVKSLEPMMLQLRYVRNNEKEFNTIKPETYVEKVEKKHADFVRVNLQNVLESAYTLEDDGIDFTDKILYELEWDVTGENKKCIPHFVKTLLVFVMFCGTIFNLVYTLFIGGQISIPQLKEWLLYWIISLAMYGCVLLPLFSVIVGFLLFYKQ